jgi:hypothetical protein
MIRVASTLWVDPVVHRAECARFDSFIVRGPTEADCDIFAGAIGKDGYGRFCIYRDGVELCVRPNRYALARALGRPLEGSVLALHECDIPLCVKISRRESLRQHVVAGSQRDNMTRMARMRRGGGRPVVPSNGLQARRERSVALRAAVRNGWDAAAVESALLGAELKLW